MRIYIKNFIMKEENIMIGEFVYTNDGQCGFVEMLGQNEFLFPMIAIRTDTHSVITKRPYECSRIKFKTKQKHGKHK